MLQGPDGILRPIPLEAQLRAAWDQVRPMMPRPDRHAEDQFSDSFYAQVFTSWAAQLATNGKNHAMAHCEHALRAWLDNNLRVALSDAQYGSRHRSRILAGRRREVVRAAPGSPDAPLRVSFLFCYFCQTHVSPF